MVQLRILSGSRAGTIFDSSRLPVTVGRSDQSDLSLDDAGVWPAHFKILWQREGLILEVEPDAFASVNNTPMQRALLRSGDLITVGAVTLGFSFSPSRQAGQGLREWLTWIALGALCLAQVAAVYWLNR